MLSILRFFLHLLQYCISITPIRGIVACDNESLVNTVLNLQHPQPPKTRISPAVSHQHPATPPNRALSPDWDIINEIVHTLQSLPFSPTIQHIKGHQDDHDEYDDLPILAQLNVDADRFAGMYQDQHGKYQPTVPLMPNTGAQLHLSDATVTTKYKQAIAYADTAPALRQYIAERNHWTEATMQQIDWKAHGTALKRQRKDACHLTKLVHDILPTNKAVSRYDPNRTENCRTCTCPVEDRDHILKCPHRSRSEWRTSFLIALRKRCDQLDTQPYIQEILLDGVEAWFSETQIDATKYPDRFSNLIRQQNSIGWRQVFNGRFSTEWSSLQDYHLFQTGKSSKTRTGTLWTVSITICIWDNFKTVWTTRNEIIHGHDDTTRNAAKRRIAQANIRRIYDKRNQLMPNDQQHLFDNIDTHLQKPTRSLINWYNTYQPMFSHSIKEAQRRSLLGVRSLRHYFQVPPPTEANNT